MPQTFQVLKCYKCNVFQVHLTKKATKWECKLCGEKQSMKRFYGLGTSKECRLHVQKLNEIRGGIDRLTCNKSDDDSYSKNPDHTECDTTPVSSSVSQKSKWLDYVDSSEETQQNIEVGTLNVTPPIEGVLELPAKRPRKCLVRSKTSKNTKTKSFQEHNDTTLLTDSMESTADMSACINKPVSKATNKTYVPPPVVTNSKWAQFVEETQSYKVEDVVEPIISNSLDPLFPFLEDYDLDFVLDL